MIWLIEIPLFRLVGVIVVIGCPLGLRPFVRKSKVARAMFRRLVPHKRFELVYLMLKVLELSLLTLELPADLEQAIESNPTNKPCNGRKRQAACAGR